MNARLYDYAVDYRHADKARDRVYLGAAFVFATSGVSGGKDAARRGRLQLDEAAGGPRVIAALAETHELPGLTLTPKPPKVDRLACLVCDRDLYRAEEDTVHLFAAFPEAPFSAEIRITCNGAPFMRRLLEIVDGYATESFAMLLAGEYSATLHIDGRVHGAAVTFTVADYTLAPMSARLVSYAADRATGKLRFELALESYQVPLTKRVSVALVEAGRELEKRSLDPTDQGRVSGELPLAGDGPLRLRISVADDPSRIAEVAIPGSRAAEREAIVVNELGRERLYSVMPEPGALPVRGGFLSDGEHNETPLLIEEIVSDQPSISIESNVQDLTVATLDLASGAIAVYPFGARRAGESVELPRPAAAVCVYVGAWIGGRPFEAYATFMAPPRVGLSLHTGGELHPGGVLEVAIDLGASKAAVPVLLSVRDARLTASDRPGSALAASVMRGLRDASAPVREGSIDLLDPPPALIDDLGETVFDDLFGGAADGEALDSLGLEAPAAATMMMPAAPAPPADETPAPARTEFPQSLFFGVVPVADRETIAISLGDALTTYVVEAFALQDGDWTQSSESVVVDQPVRADLDLPPAVCPGDPVRGVLRAGTVSGVARVALTRDGEPVSLEALGGERCTDGAWPTPVCLGFDVQAGTYRAEVRDPQTGGTDVVETHVDPVGKLRSLARELRIVHAGERHDLDSADALTLRVLPVVDAPLENLVDVTAGYAHLCCEQTAAKILAAVLMYLLATDAARRKRAEEIVLAGIARERKMITPRRGFLMYPDSDYHSKYYSRIAVRYLWKLTELVRVPDISPSLRRAAEEGVEMADHAAVYHGMQRIPKRIETMEDAYALAAAGGDAAAAEQHVGAEIDLNTTPPCACSPGRKVGDRALLAWGGATLLALGELDNGVRIANEVLRHLDDRGGLYSTVDSVAALVLLVELKRSGLIGSGARLAVNGVVCDVNEAAAMADVVETVEVIEGNAMLEMTRIREEDWGEFGAPFAVDARLRTGKRLRRKVRPGERVDLDVALGDGYRIGDLLHVCLPACLDRIDGGGRVKRFSVDLEGRDSVSVPLVVTGPPNGRQHFALCVRNMFEEERAASPGLLAVHG